MFSMLQPYISVKGSIHFRGLYICSYMNLLFVMKVYSNIEHKYLRNTFNRHYGNNDFPNLIMFYHDAPTIGIHHLHNDIQFRFRYSCVFRFFPLHQNNERLLSIEIAWILVFRKQSIFSCKVLIFILHHGIISLHLDKINCNGIYYWSFFIRKQHDSFRSCINSLS